MVLNQHKLAIFESGQFAPKLCGQFTPKLPGQFQPCWVVSLFREKVVNFTVFSSSGISLTRANNLTVLRGQIEIVLVIC